MPLISKISMPFFNITHFKNNCYVYFNNDISNRCQLILRGSFFNRLCNKQLVKETRIESDSFKPGSGFIAKERGVLGVN